MGPIITHHGRTLGSRRETIRGTVDKIIPGKVRFFGLFQEPTKIRILYDTDGRMGLYQKYGYDWDFPTTTKFNWPKNEAFPKLGTRVWVQFALAGPIEEFVGAAHFAVADRGFIEDEASLYGNESAPDEPFLPKLLVAI